MRKAELLEESCSVFCLFESLMNSLNNVQRDDPNYEKLDLLAKSLENCCSFLCLLLEFLSTFPECTRENLKLY